MTVCIVGAGEMGRWLGATLAADVAFLDVDREAAEGAARAVGDRARAVPPDAEGPFDVVAVAVPIPAVEDAIDRHGPKADLALLDVSGSMVDPLAAMGRVAPDRERVSLHPLFAAESAPGRIAVSVGREGAATDVVLEQLRDAGNDLVRVSAAEHDRAMRTVQGRAHAAVLAFALAADDVPEGIATPVYETLLELVDRVTGNTARVYGDIQTRFGGAEDVADAARRIADADEETFADLYEDAGRET